MSLGAQDIVKGLKTYGPRREVAYVVLALVFGIVDQFTSQIVPSTAQLIRDYFDPPKFIIGFTPPVKTDGALTVSKIEFPAATPVTIKPIIGSTSVAAFAGPGSYELRLTRKQKEVEQWLVQKKDIAKTGQTWEIETTDRNWGDAKALLGFSEKESQPTSGTPPTLDAAPPVSGAGAPLSGTRWSVTREDYALIGTAADPVLRSMLANALAEVGTFEDGSEREAQRVQSYWAAVGPEWPQLARQQPIDWAGAFVTWLAKQAGVPPPNNSVVFSNWAHWGDAVQTDAASAGTIAIFAPNVAGSSGRGGIVLRRTPSCIEVIVGNVAFRVVITCPKMSSLVAIRRPHVAAGG